MTAVSEVALLAGSALILLAAIGVTRFSDVLARMHSLSKATTLGLVIVLVGGAFGLRDPNDITYLVLGGALQFVSSPIGSNLLARATYLAEGIEHDVDDVDELAEALAAAAADEPGETAADQAG
jgi:multicomponent Na+:H+ antiporter subunit G